MKRQIRHDGLLAEPCPVHGLKPIEEQDMATGKLVLRCPRPGCWCATDSHVSLTAALDEWDALAATESRSPIFPVLAFESGEDDDTSEPYTDPIESED